MFKSEMRQTTIRYRCLGLRRSKILVHCFCHNLVYWQKDICTDTKDSHSD